MAFTNAVKQARHRQRVAAQHKEQVEALGRTIKALEVENAQLKRGHVAMSDLQDRLKTQAAEIECLKAAAKATKPAPLNPATLDTDAKAAFDAAVDAEVKRRDRKREAEFNKRVRKEASQYIRPPARSPARPRAVRPESARWQQRRPAQFPP